MAKTSPTTPKRWHPLPRRFRTLAARGAGAILLETAKASGKCDRSFLFLNPCAELSATDEPEVHRLFDEVDRHLAGGRFAAGYVDYEAGEVLVGLGLVPRQHEDGPVRPLAWFGVFEGVITFDHGTGEVRGDLPGEQDDEAEIGFAEIRSEGLQIGPEEYRRSIQRAQQYLAEGHSYQVNFTDRICGKAAGSPLAVYESLIRSQPVSFAAYMVRPEGAILSISPELFYRTAHGLIEVRPMKGTWPRGVNVTEDVEAERLLRQDVKNLSEHVTIVDLLRNDVGKICRYGSVRVDNLFTVERYSTLLQLTSTISGSLLETATPSMIFRSLFPSGSITGAPKRRTMEIIRELEQHPRGVYTGSIGYFGPGGEACFNVAIRTLDLQNERFVLGVGGGITADSIAEEEYEECRLKGSFLTHQQPEFALLETMRCDHGIALLDRHLSRLAASAQYFGIEFDAAALRMAVKEQEAICGTVPTRVRLVLERTGRWAFTLAPLQEAMWHGRLLLSTDRLPSRDVFLHHKTTYRGLYDLALAEANKQGYDEVLFQNEKDQLTEGAISSVFFRIDGRWLTPPLGCGVLAGVQRAVLLETLEHSGEMDVSLERLRDVEEIFVCNSVRGVRPVYRIEAAGGATLWEGIRRVSVPSRMG